MIVAPQFQRKGIGSEIIARLKNKCMTSGLRTMWLFSAEGKRDFYMKHGFTDRPQSAPGMQMKLYDRVDSDAANPAAQVTPGTVMHKGDL